MQRKARVRTALATAVVSAGLAVAASPASAACSAPVVNGQTATVTCPVGLAQTVNIPTNVDRVTMTVFGGQGGVTSLSPFTPAGGAAEGTYVSPGPYALTVGVGTQGQAGVDGGAGGTPGGGAGTLKPGGRGGGGGGRSTVSVGLTALLIAGGGGGNGTSSQFGLGGGGGGASPADFGLNGGHGGVCNSQANCFPTGRGGTQSAVGAGDGTGNSGVADAGGDAGPATGGGGGGAGYFGGGGGGTTSTGAADGGGGGGGGSTYVSPALTNVTRPQSFGGNGSVTLSYTVPNPPAITSANSAAFTVGSAGSFSVMTTGGPAPTVSLDDPGDVPAGLTFTPGPAGSGTGTIAGTPSGPAGTSHLTVRAHSTNGADAVQALTITVAAHPPTTTPPTTTPPTVTPLTPHGSIPSTGGGSAGLPASAPGGGQPVAATPTGVNVALGCNGTGSQTCTGTVSVSVRERKQGKKILGVLAKAKTKTVTVVVGQASYTIAAGKITTVKVTLNKTGRALLKRFHKLKVKVSVTVTTATGAKQLATKTVTIKAAKKKAKKK